MYNELLCDQLWNLVLRRPTLQLGLFRSRSNAGQLASFLLTEMGSNLSLLLLMWIKILVSISFQDEAAADEEAMDG